MSHPIEGHTPISAELAAILATRILQTVTRTEAGCWHRTAYQNGTGYTRIFCGPKGERMYLLAHRVMYVAAYGPIPEKATIDHICENRSCCNPAHLRIIPFGDNVLRSKGNPFAINARKTHCIHGHELPPYVRGGKRKCRPCARDAQRRYSAARRAARAKSVV